MTDSLEEAASAKDEGNAKFKAKEYQAAIDAYSRSLDLKPDQHLCYSNRCAAYLKLGASDEKALADAEKCVELMPSWAKGYHRVYEAHRALKQFDSALAVLEKGIASVEGDDRAGLEKLKSEVPKWQFCHAIGGIWNGTVNEVLGGYDQEMEFLDDNRVRVEVLGRSIIGTYWVDVSHSPHHLNIQVPHQEIPPGMPPPPPVPYIAKVDEVGLHLCCPYLRMERPKEFEGPGYVLMKGGSLAKTDDSEVANLTRSEKIQKCAQELLKAMPDKKLEEVSATDSEDAAGEKLMGQVRFESSMYSVCKLFGEDVVKEVLSATRGTIPDSMKEVKEIAELAEKLRICGMLDEDVPPTAEKEAPFVSLAEKPGQSLRSIDASAGLTRTEEPKLAAVAESSKEEEQTSGEESASSCSTVVGGVLLSVAVVAAVAFMLSKKQRS